MRFYDYSLERYIFRFLLYFLLMMLLQGGNPPIVAKISAVRLPIVPCMRLDADSFFVKISQADRNET